MNRNFCSSANVRQSSNKRKELLRLVAGASFMRMGSGGSFLLAERKHGPISIDISTQYDPQDENAHR